MQPVVVWSEIRDGEAPAVVGIFGPYPDTQAASDALEILRGLELPEGLQLCLSHRLLQDPADLRGRVLERARDRSSA
jgi:hypothetical protein